MSSGCGGGLILGSWCRGAGSRRACSSRREELGETFLGVWGISGSVLGGPGGKGRGGISPIFTEGLCLAT